MNKPLLYINRAPLFAIDRLRIGTDGHGVTTLVCFMKCPLNCVYCLNDCCHGPLSRHYRRANQPRILLLSPEELYERTKIDNIYFQATGGGICFGGGEPTLYSRYIEEFSRICHPKWKITIETSLHCEQEDLIRLAPIVDTWIVDVKTMNREIYRRYTGKESKIEEQLIRLMEFCDKDKITVKVPLIPHFNDEADVERSSVLLHEMGLEHIEKVRFREQLSEYPPKTECNERERQM